MRRNTFAVTLLIAAVAACGTVREPQCPDVKLAAVAVHALDAETGRAVVDRRVHAVARDGEYVDQGTADHGIAPLALDRAGTYHVHVEAPGYQPWTRQGVNVTRGRCAVLPAIVKARLHRWPDPDTMPEFASVVTETVEVPARRRPIQGSPEWERRLNWILEPAPVAFTFRIRHGPEPGRIGVSTTLVNLGEPLNTGHSLRRELTWGMCDFVLRAHRSADLKGEPAWDSWTWARPPLPPGSGWGCPDVGIAPELLPGDPVPGRHLDWDGHVLDILGDSLPEGRYYFQAQIEFREETIWLPAGSADLRRVPRESGSGRVRQGPARARSGPTPSCGGAHLSARNAGGRGWRLCTQVTITNRRLRGGL